MVISLYLETKVEADLPISSISNAWVNSGLTRSYFSTTSDPMIFMPSTNTPTIEALGGDEAASDNFGFFF